MKIDLEVTREHLHSTIISMADVKIYLCHSEALADENSDKISRFLQFIRAENTFINNRDFKV